MLVSVSVCVLLWEKIVMRFKNVLNKLLITALAVIVTVCAIAVAGILCSQKLEVTEYDVPMQNICSDVRIAFLSDLHCKEYGEGNTELIDLIEEQKPDIIALMGDFINRNSSDDEIKKTCELFAALQGIAPTYFTYGNHETAYMNEIDDALIDSIKKTGVRILDCEYEDLMVNGNIFRLGGMSQLAYRGGDGKFIASSEQFLTDYCDTKLPTVMLSHRPEAFVFNEAYYDWQVDLVLSGHTHGGLVRLPVIGGLCAPIQGMFPEVYYGEYEFGYIRMIVTSGLAGYGWVPRMFNPPEICVVTLTAE